MMLSVIAASDRAAVTGAVKMLYPLPINVYRTRRLSRLGWLHAIGGDVRGLRKQGLAAVLLSEEVQYRREVPLEEQIKVTCELVEVSADGSRWRPRLTILRMDGVEAALVRSLSVWIDVDARKITAPLTELRAVLESRDRRLLPAVV
jgi:acyl-CoA thioesterase FadM